MCSGLGYDGMVCFGMGCYMGGGQGGLDRGVWALSATEIVLVSGCHLIGNMGQVVAVCAKN